MSSYTKIPLKPLLIFPILLRALSVLSTPFLSKNCGVYSMYTITKNKMTTQGTTTKMRNIIFQLCNKANKVVTKQAPIANQGCNMTENFCLVLSYTTYPRKLKHIFIDASDPAPRRNIPIEAIIRF